MVWSVFRYLETFRRDWRAWRTEGRTDIFDSGQKNQHVEVEAIARLEPKLTRKYVQITDARTRRLH